MYYYKIGIMECKGTIIRDASPALLDAINRIADIFSVDKVTIPQSPRVTLDQAGTLAVAEDARREEASVPGVVTQTGPALRTGMAEEAPVVKYTKEQVKAAAAAKREKRDDMKKILDEMGAKSIPALSEDQYEEFMRKISVL